MTAVSSSALFEMEFLQAEDTMDLASSPQLPSDDLDLDLDPIHESFPEPVEDTMIDASTEIQESPNNALQTNVVETVDDDEMLDEDTASQGFPDNVSDLNMESHQPTGIELGHDEDILYEDDEEPKYHELAADSSGTVQSELEGSAPENKTQAFDQRVEEDEANHEAIPEAPNTEKAIDHDTSSSVGSSGKTSRSLSFGDEAANAEEPSLSPTSDAISASETKHSETQVYTADTPKSTQMPTTSGVDRPDLAKNTNITESSASIPHTEEVGLPTTPQTHATNFEEAVHEDNFPSDEAVHPVKILYQDSVISLFPPLHDDESQMFFLSEINLAHESLEKLLASCRDVLADTIGEDDELVLDVASMGLHISEGSKYAAEISLSQILDVYLALSHNEHPEKVEPLYCSLSSRICLASQYAYLTTAAQEGKSFTEISAEHLGTLEENNIFEQQDDSLEPTFDGATRQDDAYDEVEVKNSEEFGHAGDPIHDNEGPADDGELGYDQSDPDSRPEETPVHVEKATSQEELGEEASDINLSGYQDLDQTEISAVESGQRIGTRPIDQAAQMLNSTAQNSTDPRDFSDVHNQSRLVSTEHQSETASVQGDTASSHTMEGENGIDEDDFLNEEDLDSNEQPAAENDDAGTEGRQRVGLPGQLDEDQTGLRPDPDDEDNLLDLDAEEVVPSHMDAQPVNHSESADVDTHEDLFAATDDYSTIVTLGEADPGHTELNVNDSAPPVTPSKDPGAKRKVVEEDDEFGLFEIETPDRKRRRPS